MLCDTVRVRQDDFSEPKSTQGAITAENCKCQGSKNTDGHLAGSVNRNEQVSHNSSITHQHCLLPPDQVVWNVCGASLTLKALPGRLFVFPTSSFTALCLRKQIVLLQQIYCTTVRNTIHSQRNLFIQWIKSERHPVTGVDERSQLMIHDKVFSKS